MTPRDAYAELLSRSRERALLASCLELLGWDELTYLPAGGVTFRGRQMAFLSGRLHSLSTDPNWDDLLSAAESTDLTADPLSATAVNLRRWRRTFDRLRRVPRTLVEELAEVTTVAQQVWAEARERNRFAELQPWLERVLALKQSEAACLAAGSDLYDALLQEYEPGATSAALDRLFQELHVALQPLVDAARTREPAADPLQGRRFPIESQRRLAREIAERLGFELTRGRIDETPHPFCTTIGPGDCRIATRFIETDFRPGFFSVLHEVGHGLYEQGLDPELYGTPRGEAPSLGLHESQSRLWENGVGRSAAFWQWFYPRVQTLFGASLGEVPVGEFVASLQCVRPGVNRVVADRTTYDLHILARFELERALIHDDLRVAELPGAWRESYRQYLGVEPQSDAEGCLQDDHWPAGQIGYFPTYTLGNLYAAQLLEAVQASDPDLEPQFAAGDFESLRRWLRVHVYAAGQRCEAAELLQRATGRPVQVGPLVRALQRQRVDV